MITELSTGRPDLRCLSGLKVTRLGGVVAWESNKVSCFHCHGAGEKSGQTPFLWDHKKAFIYLLPETRFLLRNNGIGMTFILNLASPDGFSVQCQTVCI
jgi:hypothetical protein